MSRKIEISFLVQGYVNQTIELVDSCELTSQEIVDGLDTPGKIVTTIQKNGEVIDFSKDIKIGTVVSVDNHLEYSDFEDRDEVKSQIEKLRQSKKNKNN